MIATHMLLEDTSEIIYQPRTFLSNGDVRYIFGTQFARDRVASG